MRGGGCGKGNRRRGFTTGSGQPELGLALGKFELSVE